MPTFGLGVYLNAECAEACKVALQNGYRMIDSARFYENEEQVGVGIRQSGADRSKIFINYYDLFLTHSAHGGKELRLATYKALLDAKAAGHIRSVGVSNYSGKHIEEIREAGLEMPVVNQVGLHQFCQQKEVVDYCTKRRGAMDDPVITELAERYNKDPAQILIRWSLQRGFVPLPKSSQASRIISNGQVYDFNIEPKDMAKLNALDKGLKGAVTWGPVDIP
ncbi:Aldo/keto reductase [Gyrodon lividus]|nr:Aldo/keto reductase [Gyrodon lividus]